MSGTGTSPNLSGQHSSYFFLSYAHSPPLAGTLQTNPDQWVRTFFRDLTDLVERQISPGSRLAPGFFDQDIPFSANWKAMLTRALSTAEVFVPLYSPGYFARSWPGREWACFSRRLTDAGYTEPERRLVPVLWIPLHGQQKQPGLQDALALGASEPAYAENGLRALLRLAPYQASYRLILARLAERIVNLAETEPIGPSPAPDIDEVPSAFHPGAEAAVFVIAVAAPAFADLPGDRDPAGYGNSNLDWRAYPDDQELPLLEYAAQVAEQLDFAVATADIADINEESGEPRRLSGDSPGVILIDPWFVADDHGVRALESLIRDLPSWVLPVLVLDSLPDARAANLADRVRAILSGADVVRTETARVAIRGVSSLKEFVSLMPILVAEAERQFLRRGPVQRYTARPGSRPRLAGGGQRANPASSQPSEEKNA